MRGPRNSLGAPWSGETWLCAWCGERGPDRDDVAHSACPSHPLWRGRVGAPHHLSFAPAEHDAAMRARYPQVFVRVGHETVPLHSEGSR